MAEVTVAGVKCACPDCVCVFDPKGGIEADGKVYCSDSCATGHADGSVGCGHEGCDCGHTVGCACPDCICTFDPATAVKKDGKLYCSDVCADGHADGTEGCGHDGCACGTKH